MQVKKQQLEPVMEQQIGSKLGNKCDKTICYHPAYLTSMQNAPCDMPGWMNAQAGIRIVRSNINNHRYADDPTLMAESEEELKSLSVQGRGENEKTGLKFNIQKT